MGLESLTLTLNGGPGMAQVQRAVDAISGVPAESSSVLPGSFWDIRDDAYIVEVRAVARSGPRCDISVRAALCCDPGVVSAILDFMKRVSQHEPGATWGVLGERIRIDPDTPGARDELAAVFLRRRRDFLSVYGRRTIPSAAVRCGDECIDYVRNLGG